MPTPLIDRRILTVVADRMKFRAGMFLNTGTEAYRFDDRIYVGPVDRLGQTNLSTASPK